MPCANNNCGHRTWCQKLLRESIDPQECEEAKTIATWWNMKIAGLRDRDEEDDYDPDGGDDLYDAPFQD